MALRPTQGDENAFHQATALHGSVALPFLIPPAPARRGTEANPDFSCGPSWPQNFMRSRPAGTAQDCSRLRRVSQFLAREHSWNATPTLSAATFAWPGP